MEASQVETTASTPTPAQAPETSRGSNTPQGSKVGGQTLPPGNSKLSKERREEFAQTIDLLAGELPENGTPIDPSFLLDGPCGNADDILDMYRSQLQHILEYPTKDKEMEDHKAEAYKALSYGISRFKDICIYEPVRDEHLEWARSGYVGEAPRHYFDEHGKTRQKDGKTDPTFKDRVRKSAAGQDREEDSEMKDADIADFFPSDMKPYQVQWEQATKLWREILDHPRTYVDKNSDGRVRASKINYTIADMQLRDGKQRLDLKVPWEEMLVLLVYSVTHAVNPGDTSLPQDRESIHRGREVLRERLARNRQPKEWAAMMDEAIEQKSIEWSKAREQHIPESKITERNTLWPEDFLKRLHGGGAHEEPSPESKEAASGGSADGGANDGAANGSQSGRTGVNPEPTGDDMKPTPRKGVYRCELKPNYVTYEGKERRIGGLRDCDHRR
ncbi:hypothetical protein CBER1_09957 [Cercospora berteroae]|uniref:Uncharacterized protein n=1 Tax=Cercospora berteroae TaxID=357750 RepID=A0A2S6C5X9_9PEZI|nr:hypothetical protein CBER1_09957 [Cercospora berteroae]